MDEGRRKPEASVRQNARIRKSVILQLAFTLMAIGLLVLWWASQPGQEYLGARMECLLDDDFTAYRASRCGTSLVSIEHGGALQPQPVINSAITVSQTEPWPGTKPAYEMQSIKPGTDLPEASPQLELIELTAAQRCLSLNVYWEARNQPYAGQLAVAQITMNRVRDRRFPNDVCDVVYEHKQFSWFWDGKTDRPRDQRAWDRAVAVASAAMAGSGNSALDGVMHYHAVYSQPYWKDHMQRVATIGDHVFYRDQGPSRQLQASAESD